LTGCPKNKQSLRASSISQTNEPPTDAYTVYKAQFSPVRPQRNVRNVSRNVRNAMTHIHEIFGNSTLVWISSCYEKGANALTESIVFGWKTFLWAHQTER